MSEGLTPLGMRAVTLVDVLRGRAERQGEREAFVFLRYRGGGEPAAERLSYRALWARSRAVAAVLQAHCDRGDRALILAPPGLDYIAAFLGCLLAGVVAVPAYPPRNVKHLDRLIAIARDCDARVVLSLGNLANKLADWGGAPLPPTVAIDEVLQDVAAAWQDPEVGPGDLAFLQYTSGTTGTPKGVMIGHDNLMAMLRAGEAQRNWGPTDLVVSWLPPYHDLGLIAGILQPLFLGFPAVLMEPAAFLQEPARWLRALSDFGATCALAPNFAYDLAARIGPELEAQALDLSSLRHAISGGEPPRAETHERFARRFAAAGFRLEAFRPGYGLAETTLQVTLARPGIPPRVMVPSGQAGDGTELSILSRAAVSNGPPVAGAKVLVIGADMRHQLPAGAVGEI